MAFESLSYRYKITIEGIPTRWLPLIHLYDPDLPLFPIYYFHILKQDLQNANNPSDTDRAFGYIEKINLLENGNVDISLVLNKNLNIESNKQQYYNGILTEIKERLGINNPVKPTDVSNGFVNELEHANNIIVQLWNRVVTNSYGNLLPFGRLWDETFGLTRMVASFNSPSGRKGELIQTHYFLSKFGERIQSAGEIPQLDFYLLPTIDELKNTNNALNSFPHYKTLVEIANKFNEHYCTHVTIENLTLSKFTNAGGGRLNTEKILSFLNSVNIPSAARSLAIECFNSFDKGPHRTVIFLMMLSDLRLGRLNPDQLNASQLGSIYDSLEGSYQSPKVIHIYAQQSFGNVNAIPIDTWINTFFSWPLMIWPIERVDNPYQYIFSRSNNLGKIERLLWVAGQARKVHSSACNDAIWCTKYSSHKTPRGGNPLACKICLNSIRESCPVYNVIREKRIIFNSPIDDNVDFSIITNEGNNTANNQKFTSCTGYSIYQDIVDDFSPADNPSGFASYPARGHNGDIITVQEFVDLY